MQSLRYILASLALGLIAVWGSEMFFWGFPQPELTFGEWLITYVAYSICCACVLTAVIWSGVRGWPALFLGGALLGFLSEGVVVAQMYLFFPFHLVWTPLAWHALITGVCVFGLCRAGPSWPLWKQFLALVALGTGGGFFGLFWPLDERGPTIPGGDAVFAYLVGIGCCVVLGNWLLDRLSEVPRPPRLVMAIAPVFALLVWGATSVFDPNPVRVFFPLMVGLTLWAMRRLGTRGAPTGFGPRGRLWRHVLFLIVPLVMVTIVVPAWESGEAIAANLVVAGITVPVSLAWWLWLLWRAARTPRAAA